MTFFLLKDDNIVLEAPPYVVFLNRVLLSIDPGATLLLLLVVFTPPPPIALFDVLKICKLEFKSVVTVSFITLRCLSCDGCYQFACKNVQRAWQNFTDHLFICREDRFYSYVLLVDSPPLEYTENATRSSRLTFRHQMCFSCSFL